MTEAEIYRVLAQPLILALTVLSFAKMPWPRRALAAVAGALVGIAIGLVGVWAVRVGPPDWTGWAAVAVVLAAVGLMWLRRRRQVSAGHQRTRGSAFHP